jgi:cation transport ATPase
MATRKQRKRKEKEQRHEYVWVDEEGKEIAPSENGSAPSSSSGRSTSASPARSGRQPQEPSWRRSFKRGLIFAPIMLATVMLLSSKLTFTQQVTQALFIVSVFIPFSYFLDRMMYRSFQKRLARNRSAGTKRGD